MLVVERLLLEGVLLADGIDGRHGGHGGRLSPLAPHLVRLQEIGDQVDGQGEHNRRVLLRRYRVQCLIKMLIN